MPETDDPVSAFTAAVQARDLDATAALLAHGVHLSIPPLHYTRQGAREVADDVAGLFGAFGELRYDLRSRYLGQSSVTDEAVLTGRQTGSFLGSSPGRRGVVVPARLIIEYDETKITGITLWPDLAALRAAVAGADRVIDLTTATRAGGMVAALRATIPPRQTRIIAGAPREAVPQTPVPSQSQRILGPAVSPGRPVPKAPVPKQVRQRRAYLAGGTMLVAATALASWVAAGALDLPGPSSTTGPAVAVAARVPGGSGAAVDRSGAKGAPGLEGTADRGTADRDSTPITVRAAADVVDSPPDAARLAPAAQLAIGQDTVIIGSDLLFATDSAELTPRARRILDDLMTQARRQPRHGRIIVSGHTDDVGTHRYNLALSKKRAAAVAAVLRTGLAASGMTVESHGYGKTRPRRPNVSAADRQANRRVTVQFPPEG